METPSRGDNKEFAGDLAQICNKQTPSSFWRPIPAKATAKSPTERKRTTSAEHWKRTWNRLGPDANTKTHGVEKVSFFEIATR